MRVIREAKKVTASMAKAFKLDAKASDVDCSPRQFKDAKEIASLLMSGNPAHTKGLDSELMDSATEIIYKWHKNR